MEKNPSSENFRLVLSGSSIADKDKLVRELSSLYNLPLVKIDTQSLFPSGVETHLDIIRMSVTLPQDGLDFQSKLIRDRAALFTQNSECNFISDRSVIDSFVYYAMHNSMYADTKLDNELSQLTFDATKIPTLTVLLSPSDNANPSKIRIENNTYKNTVFTLIASAFEKFCISDGIIDGATFNLSSGCSTTVVVTTHTAICRMSNADTVEQKISCIEKAIEFIKLVRN